MTESNDNTTSTANPEQTYNDNPGKLMIKWTLDSTETPQEKTTSNKDSVMRRTGGIQRSTSFKMNSLQYSNAFGCTYYGAHSFCNAKDPDKDIARPITRKKRSVIMDKTTVNWNCPNNNSYYEAF